MNVKGLIGYNVFETANNVCSAIRLYKEGIRTMEDIINGVHQMHFIGIDNTTFASRIFNKLLEMQDSQEAQEAFLELFFEYFMEFEQEMTVYDMTVNKITIGEAV
jgi:hypothetical protein